MYIYIFFFKVKNDKPTFLTVMCTMYSSITSVFKCKITLCCLLKSSAAASSHAVVIHIGFEEDEAECNRICQLVVQNWAPLFKIYKFSWLRDSDIIRVVCYSIFFSAPLTIFQHNKRSCVNNTLCGMLNCVSTHSWNWIKHLFKLDIIQRFCFFSTF